MNDFLRITIRLGSSLAIGKESKRSVRVTVPAPPANEEQPQVGDEIEVDGADGVITHIEHTRGFSISGGHN